MSHPTLHLSDDLALPLDAATQTFAFIARKRAGKTYAAGKMVECLVHAGVQCVILDTVGNWYGLRLAADGKGKGLDIPVLGGLRGDIPLEAMGGALVADLVIETGRSLVVDVSQFSQADRKRFATGFGTRLWELKKAQRSPTAVHVVIEESQLIVPQFVRGDDAKMVGIFEEIIRLGGNYGIGVSMITQRPQSVNKEVLTQTECLVVLQVNGAPERKALREWIVHQGMDTHLVDELPGLPVGTAYIWSPQWLGILKKVRIGEKWTFDASATPKVGERRQQSELAPLNLEAFQEKMASTIERAKENDPAELRAQIGALKRELEKAKRSAPAPKVEEKPVPVLTKENERELSTMAKLLFEADASLKRVGDLFSGLQAEIKKRLPAGPLMRVGRVRPGEPSEQPMPHGPRISFPKTAGEKAAEAGGGLRRMMIALAQRPGLTKQQLGLRAGLSSRSGTFGTYLGRLRGSAWIEGASNLTLTDAGLQALGPYERLPEGEDLLNYWLRELGDSGAGRMLRALAECYPHAITKDDLGARAGLSAGSGTFGTYLGRLRALELVEGSGHLRASQEFFV